MAKRKSQKKNRLVAIVLILIMLISIGYAFLSTTLNINGTANISATQWSVYFNNVQIKEGSVIATTVPTVPEGSKTTTELTWEVDMSTPGEYYEFTTDIVNDGTIDAMLDSIEVSNLTADQAKYLTYTVTYADGGIINNNQKDLLKAKETETIKVGLYFKTEINAADLPSEDEKISATVKMEYVQADSTAKERAIAAETYDYEIGEVVTIGTESFYVIENSKTTDTSVKLLAKNNLVVDTLKQSTNDDYRDNTIAFSSTNYWENEAIENYNLNLNNYSNENLSTDAIAVAKAYATSLGVGATGRLMELEDFSVLGYDMEALISKYDEFLNCQDETEQQTLIGEYMALCETEYASWIYSKNFWLGSALDSGSVWGVDGEGSFLGNDLFDSDNFYGVRPVINVLKSNI